MTDAPAAPVCHACTSDALVVVRIAPHRRKPFEGMRDVPCCKVHRQDVRRLGSVISETPLSDQIFTRNVKG